MTAVSRRLIKLAIILLTGLVAIPATAQSLYLGSTPTRPTIAGFDVGISMAEGGRFGYQPIELVFKPTGTRFRRQRRVTVFVRPQLDNSRLLMTFQQTVLVEEGATKHTVMFFVPRYSAWDRIEFWLEEDGSTINSSNATFGLTGLRGRDAQQDLTIGILAAHSQHVLGKPPHPAGPWRHHPDVRTLVTIIGEGPLPEGDDIKEPRLSNHEAKVRSEQTQPAWVQFRTFHEADWHDNWLGYSQLDVMLVPEPLLRRTLRSQPSQAEALKAWIAAGGNLWVYAADFNDPALLEPSMYSKPDSNAVSTRSAKVVLGLTELNDTSDLSYHYWQGVVKESLNYNAAQRNQFKVRQEVFDELVKAGHPFTEDLSPKQLQAMLRSAPFGTGQIVLIDDPDPFPGSFRLWHTVAQMHARSDLAWVVREGIDISQGNNAFWDWLIPSVGQPPVTSFVILNTLFVVIVGPFSYFFFRRRERLYLLYFFAPVMAIGVTISLFAYALLSEGVQTQARIRQMTWMDADADYQLTHARQSYFKTFGSRSRIELDTDVAVYPVRRQPVGNPYYYGRRERNREKGLVQWIPPKKSLGGSKSSGGTQAFGDDFFPIRDQVQYLIKKPRKGSGGVQFRSDPYGKASLTNETNRLLRPLIACANDGSLWMVDRIEPGQTLAARQIKQSDVERVFAAHFVPATPNAPQLAGSTQRWDSRMPLVPTVSELEMRASYWTKKMAPGHFIGITDLDEDLFGVPDLSLLESVHLVMGVL